MAGPSDPRFPLSAIRKALDAAGIPDEYQDLVFDALKKSRKKRGRKQEDDRKALRRVFFLAAEDPGMTLHAAAAVIARSYPEPQREAARKRLARKANAMGYEEAMKAGLAPLTQAWLREKVERATVRPGNPYRDV